MKKLIASFQLIIALILVLSSSAAAYLPAVPAAQRLHPALAALAAQSPQQLVSVIVMQAGDSDAAERAARSLGGVITKDLHIIHAFSATMPASAVLRLAASPTVRWVSPDAGVVRSGMTESASSGQTVFPVSNFPGTIDLHRVWALGLHGDGVAIAIIDSGVTDDRDFDLYRNPHSASRLIVQEQFNSDAGPVEDSSGHGTFIAGLVGGNGLSSGSRYMGVAPNANLISLKISNETGMALESDVVEAMQWVYDHKNEYSIRVVNLSLNSTLEQSYHNSPMDAAAEILWFNGVVVVASSGNYSEPGAPNPANAAPANDPFIITVGASDEHGTPIIADDTFTNFTAFATTDDGFQKPEILAPGKDIISVLADNSSWGVEHPERVILDGDYFRLSGTSTSAPLVTGAVALLLQSEPNLTPDQVKYRLTHASNTLNGYPYLEAYTAITTLTTESANTGIPASQLLWSGSEVVAWDSVSWNSVSWNSVSWNSVSWNSVSWNSVSWNSTFWEP